MKIQTPLARPSHFVPLATPSDKVEVWVLSNEIQPELAHPSSFILHTSSLLQVYLGRWVKLFAGLL